MPAGMKATSARPAAENTEHLACTACGFTLAMATLPSTCPRCDGILDVRLPLAEAPAPAPTVEAQGIWRWAAWLPSCAPEDRVTLGEGGTPLLRCDRLAARRGLERLWIKNDAAMPTGSFKDRALAVATSLAKHYGKPGVVLSSSGNAGASAAAYAARAGLPAVVLAPYTAPRSKLGQILVHGARLVTVAGATSDCCRLARLAAERHGWVNVTTTYYCPYGVDGYATIAYELEALQPDVVLLPISDGPLLAGMMKGFERLRALGRVKRVPRPVAVQPTGCAPIVRALEEGGKVRPWRHQFTLASALNDTLEGYERDGDYTLAWLRRFDGTAVAVSDEEIVRAIADMAAAEGVFVEPSAATPVAAIDRLLASGWLDRDAKIVAVATGHGLKDVPGEALPPLPRAIAPTPQALAAALRA
jgi:threonine synthase